MSLTKEEKAKVIKEFAISPNDTGSPEVQIAILTFKIKYLTDHFKKHPKDFHSKKGFIQMVNRRKKLLNYLKKEDPKRHEDIIKKLGLRK